MMTKMEEKAMDAIRYDHSQQRASRKQRLLNCAAWNVDQAKRAEQAKDMERANRLIANAQWLYEQADETEIGAN